MIFKRGLLRYAVIVNHKLVKGYGLHLFESSTEPDASAYAENYVHDAFVDVRLKHARFISPTA